MDKEDIDKYEKDYLEKLEQKKKENDKDWAVRKKAELEKQEEEFQKKLESIGGDDALTLDDYVVLSSYALDDPRIQFNIGTIEGMKSAIKLFEIGCIRVMDRPLTFSEKEQLEIFKNTPQFRQRASIIKKVADKEFYDKFNEMKLKLQLKNGDEPLEITNQGKLIFEKKKSKLEKVVNELKTTFRKKLPSEFKTQIEKNRNDLPLFLIMGLVNGSMMGMMMAKMDMNMNMYMQNMQMMGNEQGYADGGDFGEGDFGDSGDGGGFMDAGFQPGF